MGCAAEETADLAETLVTLELRCIAFDVLGGDFIPAGVDIFTIELFADPSVPPEGDVLNLTAGNDVRIGSRPSNNDHWFNGMIDEVYLYDRALTPEEIAGAAGRTMNFDR